MAIYVKKLCPKCGYTYENWQQKKVVLGSPIRTCPKCGESFIDKSYTELAIDENEEDYPRRIESFGVIALIIGLVFIAFDRSTKGDGTFTVFGGVCSFVGVIMIISNLISYKKRIQDFDNIRKESEKRLENPEYAKVLSKMGYIVPEQYLKVKKTVNRAIDISLFSERAFTGTCDICKKERIDVATCKIKDKTGTRYRPLCEECIKKYDDQNVQII